ncbi:MAG: hypothetical protein WD733_09090 [Bryobacterales bacterium]
MFSRRRELNEVFALQDVVPCGAATVKAAEAVSVITPAAAWAYAAAIPRRDAGTVTSGSVVVEVDATVTAGSVGFGCLTADQKVFLDESIQRKEDGPVTVFLRLDSLDDCGWLMVRNGGATGEPSAAVLRSVRVFQIEDAFRREIYIFDHIFKTGGTTFDQSYLRAGFRAEEYVILRGSPRENAEDQHRLQSLAEAEKRKLRVVAGHNSGTLRDTFPEAKLLTLVRDPAARAISGYLHARFHPDSRAIIGQHMDERGTSLQEFVEADLFASRYEPFVSVQDWQAKTLLGEAYGVADLAREESVAEAIQRRFWLVGYTEALELFVFYLHRTEGFPLVLFNNRLVRGDQRLVPTPQDLATIRRFNLADEAVYRAARKEFDRRVAAIWNDEVEQDYRWYMNRLSSFRRVSGGDPNAMRLFRL